MVMEIPTPQCVGREFVRQYYTLLNKAPLHLHRFYNHDSSFLHGGLDKRGHETRPVVGQQDIHERIMQLNFRDCHAKIRQVDSLETLSDGVVVQVSGELSNGGQPMRRFMQTFVLVLQSPKKYYVRNDIFRYQDEIFSEDESTLTDIDVEEPVPKKQGSPTQEDDGYHEAEVIRNGVYGNEPTPASVEQDWEEEELEEVDDDEDEETPPLDEAPSSSLVTSLLLQPPHSSPTPPIVEHSSMEPKTYANMVSKNNPGLPPSPIVPQANVIKEVPPQQPVPRRAPSPEDSDRGIRRGIGGNFTHYNDTQQLFVGNLTHSITEEDLKAHFTKFGRVLDMRINTKQTQKLGGGKVPNFGFIVFEDEESVQKVLQARPIFFNDHRLNVEEKKRPKDNHNRLPPTTRPSPRMGPGSARGRPMGSLQGRGGMRGGFVPRR